MPVSTADDRDVEDGADDERGDDADGHVALRVLGLLGVGGDRVEADVGEEDDRRAGQHAQRLAARAGLARQTVWPKKLKPASAEGRERAASSRG